MIQEKCFGLLNALGSLLKILVGSLIKNSFETWAFWISASPEDKSNRIVSSYNFCGKTVSCCNHKLMILCKKLPKNVKKIIIKKQIFLMKLLLKNYVCNKEAKFSP